MIENETQYLLTFRQARRFEQAIREMERRPRRGELADLDDVILAAMRSQHDDLVSQMKEYDAKYTADRVGDWIPTFAGRRFWLLDPRPQDFEIADIAQGLSRISRFNGWTLGDIGYTVAQHSVYVSRVVQPAHALFALLHDAPEAYAGDVVRPLKQLLGEVYEEIEDRIMRAVALRYGFEMTDEAKREVKWADEVLLATETRDLVPRQLLRHDTLHTVMEKDIRPWSQEKSKGVFLARFKELTGGKA